jgi:protein-L-isoaspartate(D-aspartate) O-methyltransferase
MVASQLRTSSVNDPRVVEAMALVPREQFVPAGQRELAYRDRLIPAPGGRRLNSPLASGLLLTLARVEPSDNVLLIGAGGGYTAAVLGELAARVVAVEEDPALAALAREALSGNAKVTLVEGPLAAGAPGQAPFDVLLIDGAVEEVPEALVAQLRVGGRAAAGSVDRGVTRICSGQRTESAFALADQFDVECAVLPGFARPRRFRF